MPKNSSKKGNGGGRDNVEKALNLDNFRRLDRKLLSYLV